MGLIISLIIAGVVGWVASIVMKTDDQMGFVSNIVVGIVGGVISTLLFGRYGGLLGITISILGACIAIFIWQWIAGQRHV